VIVVPTYRERDNVPELLRQLADVLPEARVLIVDDASGDGLPEWVKAQPGYGSTLDLLERKEKAGLGPALHAGYLRALELGAETIAQLDADFSHDPADLPRLLEALEQGQDLVIGSRYCKGGEVRHWSGWRRVLSLLAGCYVRFWTRLPLRDPTAGFRVFRATALREVIARAPRCDGYGFQVEIAHSLWKQGRKLMEVPVVFTERRQGASKLSSALIWESILEIPRL
jgi:dolichol-phosphate mannosyltransferase